MAVLATENPRFSNLIKSVLWPEQAYTFELVTVNEAAATDYKIGTVLGKITASGKYLVAVETAADGSKVPAAVVVQDVSVAATTDTKVLALVRGPAIVSKDALILDATYDNATKVNTALAALTAMGVLVNTTV